MTFIEGFPFHNQRPAANEAIHDIKEFIQSLQDCTVVY